MFFKIEFEDNGQDFLSFVIDTEAQIVVTAQPLQHSIWAGARCTQRAFEVGGHVQVDPLWATCSVRVHHKISSVDCLGFAPPQLKPISAQGEPNKKRYGWVDGSIEEEAGWEIEGGEEAYYAALKQWENPYYFAENTQVYNRVIKHFYNV